MTEKVFSFVHQKQILLNGGCAGLKQNFVLKPKIDAFKN